MTAGVYRRVATRYDKTDANYLGFFCLALLKGSKLELAFEIDDPRFAPHAFGSPVRRDAGEPCVTSPAFLPGRRLCGRLVARPRVVGTVFWDARTTRPSIRRSSTAYTPPGA